MTEPINVLTRAGFEKMEASVAKECADLPQNIGISVALWRLRELLQGYRYAIDHNYPIAGEVSDASPQGNEVPIQEGHPDQAGNSQG